MCIPTLCSISKIKSVKVVKGSTPTKQRMPVQKYLVLQAFFALLACHLFRHMKTLFVTV